MSPMRKMPSPEGFTGVAVAVGVTAEPPEHPTMLSATAPATIAIANLLLPTVTHFVEANQRLKNIEEFLPDTGGTRATSPLTEAHLEGGV
jgi:hypothetical protein